MPGTSPCSSVLKHARTHAGTSNVQTTRPWHPATPQISFAGRNPWSPGPFQPCQPSHSCPAHRVRASCPASSCRASSCSCLGRRERSRRLLPTVKPKACGLDFVSYAFCEGYRRGGRRDSVGSIKNTCQKIIKWLTPLAPGFCLENTNQ